MEIKYSNVNANMDTSQTKTQTSNQQSGDVKFADELQEQARQNDDNSIKTNNMEVDVQKKDETINQTEENSAKKLKDLKKLTDNDKEGANMINNDFSIENKNNLAQMSANMNFDSNGQPFSSFMNGEEEKKRQEILTVSAKELAEEAAILSTMAENVAIANRNTIINEQIEPENIIVSDNNGIKKVDFETKIVEEVITRYDNIIMNENDVEVFANLVNGKDININNLTSESLQKSVNVSKTLSDMLVKAMETNKPIRIEFDNGISVIIKISRDGKLSADFLPSTQVAEAYLKENLPLLKQKFSEQNIDYDELNQRERRNQNREQNSKKGRENE